MVGTHRVHRTTSHNAAHTGTHRTAQNQTATSTHSPGMAGALVVLVQPPRACESCASDRGGAPRVHGTASHGAAHSGAYRAAQTKTQPQHNPGTADGHAVARTCTPVTRRVHRGSLCPLTVRLCTANLDACTTT